MGWLVSTIFSSNIEVRKKRNTCVYKFPCIIGAYECPGVCVCVCVSAKWPYINYSHSHNKSCDN